MLVGECSSADRVMGDVGCRLVALVRAEQAASLAAGGTGGPLWGAKITGGGCGGTVCVLAQAGPEVGLMWRAHQCARFRMHGGMRNACRLTPT